MLLQEFELGMDRHWLCHVLCQDRESQLSSGWGTHLFHPFGCLLWADHFVDSADSFHYMAAVDVGLVGYPLATQGARYYPDGFH